MRRTLNDAEWQWAEALHFQWLEQRKAEGGPLPDEPLDSVIQAAIIGLSRLNEATQDAIDKAVREQARMKVDGVKDN